MKSTDALSYVRSLLTFGRNVLPHLQDRSIGKPTIKNQAEFWPACVTSFSALKKEEYISPKHRRLHVFASLKIESSIMTKMQQA
jgi:hypothetical protein